MEDKERRKLSSNLSNSESILPGVIVLKRWLSLQTPKQLHNRSNSTEDPRDLQGVLAKQIHDPQMIP